MGAAVILAPVLLVTPWFMQDPLFWRLFAFPMLLAPGLIVPLLVALHLLVVWRLLERGWRTDTASVGQHAAIIPDQSITLEKS